jgi:hypothetical protein
MLPWSVLGEQRACPEEEEEEEEEENLDSKC